MPRYGFRHVLYFAALFIASPMLCLCAAIEVNGTTCEVGSCASPGTLNPGQSIPSQTFSFYYTLPNTDEFLITGTYSASGSASGNAPSISFEATATFVGNSTHTSFSTDTVSVDLLQKFAYNNNPDGTYSEIATLSAPNVPPGSYSETTAQLSFDGKGIGLLGVSSGGGTVTEEQTADLTGLSNPSLADFNYTFTLVPSGNAVPEPAGSGWLGLGTLVVAALFFRRRVDADMR